MNLVVGENILDGKMVIVEVRDNGYFLATFPNWPDMYNKPFFIEVSTIPLLTALVMAALPLHP